MLLALSSVQDRPRALGLWSAESLVSSEKIEVLTGLTIEVLVEDRWLQSA